jgi:hypothetical protein
MHSLWRLHRRCASNIRIFLFAKKMIKVGEYIQREKWTLRMRSTTNYASKGAGRQLALSNYPCILIPDITSGVSVSCVFFYPPPIMTLPASATKFTKTSWNFAKLFFNYCKVHLPTKIDFLALLNVKIYCYKNSAKQIQERENEAKKYAWGSLKTTPVPSLLTCQVKWEENCAKKIRFRFKMRNLRKKEISEMGPFYFRIPMKVIPA